jgi:hypothetical protein
MVVGVSPPSKRAASRRADRFGASTDADSGHGHGMDSGGGSLGDQGGDCRSIDVWVECFGHLSGGLQVNVGDAGRLHDKLAPAKSVADVGSSERWRNAVTALGHPAEAKARRGR